MMETREGIRAAYAVLAECKWHLLGIATNLDPDGTVLTEDLSHSDLKCLISLALEEALKVSASKL